MRRWVVACDMQVGGVNSAGSAGGGAQSSVRPCGQPATLAWVITTDTERREIDLCASHGRLLTESSRFKSKKMGRTRTGTAAQQEARVANAAKAREALAASRAASA